MPVLFNERKTERKQKFKLKCITTVTNQFEHDIPTKSTITSVRVWQSTSCILCTRNIL